MTVLGESSARVWPDVSVGNTSKTLAHGLLQTNLIIVIGIGNLLGQVLFDQIHLLIITNSDVNHVTVCDLPKNTGRCSLSGRTYSVFTCSLKRILLQNLIASQFSVGEWELQSVEFFRENGKLARIWTISNDALTNTKNDIKNLRDWDVSTQIFHHC